MKNEKNKSILIFWLIMVISLVISTLLYDYKFELFEFPMDYSMFLIPFIYFGLNRICFNSKIMKPIFCILGALIVQSIIFAGTYYFSDIGISKAYISSIVLTFSLTCFLAVILNKIIIKKEKLSYFRIFSVYLIILVLHSLIFQIILNKGIPQDFFIIVIFFSLIKIAVGMVLSFIEYLLSKNNKLLF